MVGRNILLCLTTSFFAWKATAFLSIGPSIIPSIGPSIGLTPDACKTTMSQGFKLQYVTFMRAFLIESLNALENAAIEIRDGLPIDHHNSVKLTATAEAARELRGIVENPSTLDDKKLAYVIERVQFYWGELTTLSTDKSKLQSHLDTVAKAWQTFCEVVVGTWGKVSIVAKVLDTSQIPGFDDIDADVKKTQNLSATGENQNVYNELMGRILQFFGIDESLIFQANNAPNSLTVEPCLTLDACKSTMSQLFKFEYRTMMTAFLSESLYALENAAIEIRDGLPIDHHNSVKLTATAEAARELRGIVENPSTLDDKKLAYVIERVQFYWGELTTLSTDKSKLQSHLDRVAKAWQNFCELVIQAWGQASILIRALDTSQLSGFDDIDADVKQTQNLSATGENQNVYNELMGRILEFVGIDKSLIYQYN